jgi:hypothetical protein
MPDVLEQKDPRSTWKLITGGSGERGVPAVPCLSQGALFSLANVACHDNKSTIVRFNEIYFGMLLFADEEVRKAYGAIEPKQFAGAYEKILASPDVKGCRMIVDKLEDLTNFRIKEKPLEKEGV